MLGSDAVAVVPRTGDSAATLVFVGDDLRRSIVEAAGASTLEELGADALEALGRALRAAPVFLAVIERDLARTRSFGARDPSVFGAYLRDVLPEDPLWRAVRRVGSPVCVLEQHVDRRTLEASRGYREFHRPHDFEHHLAIRIHGAGAMTPGAVVIGMTRGARMHPFDEHDARAVAQALPAFQGAARRLMRARTCDLRAAAKAAGLTRAEHDVASVLMTGASNAGIAAELHVSPETVKTHLSRIFRKLEVGSRTQALLELRRRTIRS